MAGKIVEVITHEGFIALGPLSVPSSAIVSLPAGDASKNGIVTCNERRNLRITGADGRLTNYTVSLYVARDPADETEAAAVEKAGKDQKARAEDRERKLQDTRERETAAVRSMTASTIMDTMRANNLLRNVAAQ